MPPSYLVSCSLIFKMKTNSNTEPVATNTNVQASATYVGAVPKHAYIHLINYCVVVYIKYHIYSSKVDQLFQNRCIERWGECKLWLGDIRYFPLWSENEWRMRSLLKNKKLTPKIEAYIDLKKWVEALRNPDMFLLFKQEKYPSVTLVIRNCTLVCW